MEEPREETEREALLFGRTPAKGAGYASRRGDGGRGRIVHHFIAGTNENIHRLPPPLHLCSVEMTERCKEVKKKKKGADERRKKRENGKGHDI